MRIPAIAAFLLLIITQLQAQNMPTNRDLAVMELKALKNGALVVRLKTNDRSIELYRKAGKTELADKIMDERRVQNQKIMDAFKNYFDFCKVYFIYAKNTKELLAGRQDIFLNDTLGLDTTIRMKENYYLIAEYGDITSNMRTDEYHYSGVYHTEPSTNTASTSVIFLSDTSLTQLKEPFPFYTEVYLDNYNKAVFNLSKSIAKAYISFLAKEDEKRLREKLKEDANSQPH